MHDLIDLATDHRVQAFPCEYFCHFQKKPINLFFFSDLCNEHLHAHRTLHVLRRPMKTGCQHLQGHGHYNNHINRNVFIPLLFDFFLISKK